MLALADRLAHTLLLGLSGSLVSLPTEELAQHLRLKAEMPGQTDDLKFSMPAAANVASWPRLCDELTERLQKPLRPLHVSAEPDFDAM